MRRALAVIALAMGATACSGGGDDTPVAPIPTPSIGVTLSPSTGTAARGASVTSAVTLTRGGSYTGTVSLTADGLPSGVTATFAPAQLTGATSSASVTFAVGAAAAPGTAAITVRAAGAGVTAASTSYSLTVPTPAITLAAGSATANVVQGTAASVALTITRSNGFAGDVTLAASGLPTGVTASFAPATLTGTATSSTMTLTVAASAAAGTSPVTVTASGTGVAAQTATVGLTITAATIPAVSLTATPASLSVTVGQSGISTLTVARTGGFSGAVVLAVSGAPAGVTPTLSAASLATGVTTSTLTMAAAANATPGAYNLTVTATGTGVTTQTTTIALTVAAAPGITVTAGSPTLAAAAGSSATSAVAITRVGGFAGDVALTLEGAPTGVTAAFTPPSIAAGATTSSLALTVGAGTAPGSYTLTVRASGTGVTAQTTTIALTVSAAQGYTLSATATGVTQGATSTSTVTITRTGGFTGAVNLTIGPLPTGVSAAFNPASVTGSSSTITFTALANAAAGPFNATITGAATGLANVTTSVAGTVTASGGGGGNIAWRFCDPTDLPLFFAVRSGTSGAWTRVTAGANNTYSFSQTGVGSVAIVRPLEDGVANVAVFNFTATEMAATALQECTSNPLGKSLNGSFANLGAGQTGSAYLNGGFGSATGPSTTFGMTEVGDGIGDLLAFRYATTLDASFIPSLTPDRVALRRNVNYAAGSTIPVIDFTGAESFAPATATYSVTGVGAGEFSQTITSFATGNGTSGSFLFGSLVPTTGPRTVYGVPSNRLAAGDFHLVFATAGAQDGNTVRGVFQYNRELANRTIALGGQLTAASVTSLGASPYVRLRASGSWQAEYGDGIGVTFQQTGQGTSRVWTTSSSRAFYNAGGSYAEELPDLSGVSGFNTNWGLRPGVATTAALSANGGIAGTIGVPGEGSTWRFASRTSTITP